MRRALSILALCCALALCATSCAERRQANANRPSHNAAAQTTTPASAPRADATPHGDQAAPHARAENTPPATASSEEENKRHRLFQAAATTRDRNIIRRTGRRLGLFNPRNEPTADYRPFVEKHLAWAREDAAFVRDMNTPQKAREYLNQHK